MGTISLIVTSEPEIRLEFGLENTHYMRKPNEYNHAFLLSMQSYARDVLQTRGHLFVNDLFDMLGFPRVQEGQIVGWAIDRSTQAVANNLFTYEEDEHQKIWVTITPQGNVLDSLPTL